MRTRAPGQSKANRPSGFFVDPEWVKRFGVIPELAQHPGAEDHPAIENKMTARLARAIVQDARHLSITEIARRYGLSWHTVMTLVHEWSSRLQARRRKQPCRVLLIDETSLRRRHRYVTVAANAETGEILAVVPHRDFAPLSRFFSEQGHRAIAPRSSATWATPPTSLTASTSCAGSRPG